jgi:hypothetical protein
MSLTPNIGCTDISISIVDILLIHLRNFLMAIKGETGLN